MNKLTRRVAVFACALALATSACGFASPPQAQGGTETATGSAPAASMESASAPASSSGTDVATPQEAPVVPTIDGCDIPQSLDAAEAFLRAGAKSGGDLAPEILEAVLNHDIDLLEEYFVSESVLRVSRDMQTQTADFYASLTPDNTESFDPETRCFLAMEPAAASIVIQDLLDDPSLTSALPTTTPNLSVEELRKAQIAEFFGYLVYPSDAPEAWDGIEAPITDESISAYIAAQELGRDMLGKAVTGPTFLLQSCRGKLTGFDTSCDIANLGD